MAREIRIIDLSDIKAFRLQCRNCKSEVVQTVSAYDTRPPERCPICLEHWDLRDVSNMPRPHWKLMTAFVAMLNSDEPPPMTIRFEIDSEN